MLENTFLGLVGRVVNVSAQGGIYALGFRLAGNMAHGRRRSGQAVRLSHNPRRPLRAASRG